MYITKQSITCIEWNFSIKTRRSNILGKHEASKELSKGLIVVYVIFTNKLNKAIKKLSDLRIKIENMFNNSSLSSSERSGLQRRSLLLQFDLDY